MSIDSLLDHTIHNKRRRKLILTIIIAVVVLHLLAGVGAGLFVVAQYFMSTPAQFEMKKDIRLPAKTREHKMNMAEFDGLTPKPSFNDKMKSLRPTDFPLPDLPKIPMDQMLPLDPSEMMADTVSSLVGTAGLGGGGLGAGGLGGTGTGFSFMGIQAKGRRIVLLFDVSSSVVNKAAKSGVPMSKIQEETIKLIEELGINTRFGIYQFVRNYKPFRSELLPASKNNKEAAKSWVQTEWSESGQMSARSKGVVSRMPNGIEMLLEDVFKQDPDVLFIISDGSFQKTLEKGAKASGEKENIDNAELRRKVEMLQKNLASSAQIHFIGFEMKPEDKKELQMLTRANKGTLREIGKD